MSIYDASTAKCMFDGLRPGDVLVYGVTKTSEPPILAYATVLEVTPKGVILSRFDYQKRPEVMGVMSGSPFRWSARDSCVVSDGGYSSSWFDTGAFTVEKSANLAGARKYELYLKVDLKQVDMKREAVQAIMDEQASKMNWAAEIAANDMMTALAKAKLILELLEGESGMDAMVILQAALNNKM